MQTMNEWNIIQDDLKQEAAKTGIKRLNVNFPLTLHRNLKIEAAKSREPMTEIMTRLIWRFSTFGGQVDTYVPEEKQKQYDDEIQKGESRRLNVDLPISLHRKFKVESVKRGTTMSEVLIRLVYTYLN